MAGWGFMKEVVLDFYFFLMEKRFARMTENGSQGRGDSGTSVACGDSFVILKSLAGLHFRTWVWKDWLARQYKLLS